MACWNTRYHIFCLSNKKKHAYELSHVCGVTEKQQVQVSRLLLKMVRKLKFHEQKLLKKVDFMNWKVDNNLHEAKVLRKFEVRKREDYTK